MLMLFLVLGLNLVISFLNARNVGRIWAESKAVGGWVRLLAWCGAIQSAAGFTFVYAVVVGYIAVSTGYLPAAMLGVMMNLICIMLIVPLIGSGIFITIQSWIAFARDKSPGIWRRLNTPAARTPPATLTRAWPGASTQQRPMACSRMMAIATIRRRASSCSSPSSSRRR